MKIIFFYFIYIVIVVRSAEDDKSISLEDSNNYIQGRALCGDLFMLCASDRSRLQYELLVCEFYLKATEDFLVDKRQELQQCRRDTQNSVKNCETQSQQEIIITQTQITGIEKCIFPIQTYYTLQGHESLFRPGETSVYFARGDTYIRRNVEEAEAECNSINMSLLRVTPEIYTEILLIIISLSWHDDIDNILTLSSAFNGCGKFHITNLLNTPITTGVIPCDNDDLTIGFARFFCLADPFCYPYLIAKRVLEV